MFSKNLKLFLLGVVAAGLVLLGVGASSDLRERVSCQNWTGIIAKAQAQTESGSTEERGLVPCKLSECTFCDLFSLLERIFYWLLSLAFVVAVLFTVISGFLYIVSVGDQNVMGMAKEGLKYSIIGFVICLTCWLAVHIVYILLGYSGESWWQIDCQNQANESGQTSQLELDRELYKNEVALESPGGRNNPISLPELAEKGLADIPENKYFFIHGLGGQPLENTAAQLAKIAQKAKEQKTVVYAISPSLSPTGEIGSANLIRLDNFLTANQKKTLQNFSDLVMKLAIESPSFEIPIIKTAQKSAKGIASFNNIWPQNPNFYEGEAALYDTLSSVTKNGLIFKENGPIAINWPEGKVPKNFSDFTINLKLDEKTNKYVLDIDDPVDITLPTNISPQAAREAANNLAETLSLLEKRKSAYSGEEDLYSDLLSLLLRPKIGNEETGQGESKGNDQGIFRDFFWDKNGNYYKKRTWESNGTGILPSAISTVDKPLTLKQRDQLVAELKKSISDSLEKDNKPVSNGDLGLEDGFSLMGGREDNNSSKRQNDTSSASQEPLPPVDYSNLNIDPDSAASAVSIGINRPLSLKERGKIRELIISIQKEEYEKYQKDLAEGKTGLNIPLNMPVDYVLCLIQAESSFKPTAMSPTGAAGLGQHTDDSQREAAEMMKKTAPNHYNEFSKKYGKDLTQLMSSRASGLRNVKATLARDANLAAAMTYDFLQVKARNVLKINRPVSMNDLQRITYRYIGDGNEGSQWRSIQRCMNTNSWATAAKK
ncbi:MAG: hypothetical protein FJZ04_00860 [Candidatus Moranbacteria bacterium]|nr:hypothetical protein [Candidatus Moranbacteria bacterium]